MINQYSTNLFIFVALECEAKALVRQFQLKKENAGHPFSIYKNDKAVLTVTGVGKIAMAAGVAYSLAIYSGSPFPVLVNIGIAGQKSQPVGKLLMASKIFDLDSGKVFYPQVIGANWPEMSVIQTSSMPNAQYNQDCLNDMEASAFYETAVKFSSSELIHCLKVVSDNEDSSIGRINAKVVAEWFTEQSAEIEQICHRFLQLQALVVPGELQEYSEIVDQWHFTVTGKIRLKSLLKRWAVLSSAKWVNDNETDCRSGRDVLRKLEADVDCLDVFL